MSELIKLLSNRNVHKLAGTALAGLGLATGVGNVTGWRELTLGALYSAVMHVTGGIKKVAD